MEEKMLAVQLRKQSSEELGNTLLELRREQLRLRIQQTEGEVGQTHLVRRIRRTIARIKTLLREGDKDGK